MDKYNLDRFVSAQNDYFDTALKEIQNGYKRSHWMWFIFPQIAGLGHSEMAEFYAISCEEEARAYMEHPILRDNLLKISNALLKLKTDDAAEVIGYPDDLKLRSSMTLFAYATFFEYDVFQKVLDKYFGGEPDRLTIDILKKQRDEKPHLVFGTPGVGRTFYVGGEPPKEETRKTQYNELPE